MSWRGIVYVFPEEDGTFKVGCVLPPGSHKEGSFLVYKCSSNGAFPPTKFPEMEAVNNLDTWMELKRAVGFSFTPTTMLDLAS